MSDIVYAELSSTDDHMDTETGDLRWYSDGPRTCQLLPHSAVGVMYFFYYLHSIILT